MSLVLAGYSLSVAQRGRLLQRYAEQRFTRDAAPNTGPVPDYSKLTYWAASPDKPDPGDSIPLFLKGEQRTSRADVFFIHPTSYIGDGDENEILNPGSNRRDLFEAMQHTAWNADLTDTAVNRRTDSRAILYQASVFNGSARVFAPRYRQANIKAFFVRDSPSAQKAFDLAYGDIKAAFAYYLAHANQGRPIIIASHSQGTMHAIRLLREFFDGKPLQQQLVCAYLIGYHIPVNTFAHIPVGSAPTATGCFVGWRSYQKGANPRLVAQENGNSVCVNPLTWTTATDWVSREQHAGALLRFNLVVPQSISAGIEPASKILWVTLPDKVGERIGKMENLHTLDYNLFWMDIRHNVKARIDAYLAQQR
ncbi:DUF3089 domain-containing protein [Nibrella viscosa]|uniref:DUF3089 domain-containing protein n=2 Tax=Nibrella viscosa TaxID=1084524 RepID=A0ABP8KSM2_9BACT